MGSLVKRGKTQPLIRQKALALTQNLNQKDRLGEVRAIFNFVQNGIRYVRDIHNVETLHYPEIVLQQESGDCDDKAVLIASLLESIGHPTRFVAVGFAPGSYSHVFTDVMVGRNKWLTLEPTEPQPMGWRVPNIVEIADPWYN